MGKIDSASDKKHLLSNLHADNSLDGVEEKKKLISLLLVKWLLKITMWAVFIWWVIVIILFPVEWFNAKYTDWIEAGDGSVYGIAGRALLVYSCPIVTVAVLASVYQIILDSEGEDEQLQLQVHTGKPSYKLWTFPVTVGGVMGVVSAAEGIGILVFIFYLIWSLVMFSIRNIQEASHIPNSLIFLIYTSAIGFGDMGTFVLGFLFLPVARGSTLLRLINVPFEHATKYHIWLGNVTMLFLTLHGIGMTVYYAANGDFKEILTWGNYNFCNLAGVIALVAGVLMWITSIHPIRTKCFESFFYTHQLYIVFIIFFSLHVGSFFFAIAAGEIFVFFNDRFLRFCQSRTIVDVVSTKYLPCGVVELALAKPAKLRYNALSFVFVRIREVSRLQWHPFSISSSPLDGEGHLSVMIKVQGEWTTKLKSSILTQYKLTTSVEGPYGYKLPYYIRYEYLVLVAGGVGIAPFLAILSDVLHRIRDEKRCLSSNILLVWAIKSSNELPLLSRIDAESICPSFSNKLNLEIRIYVTQASEPSEPVPTVVFISLQFSTVCISNTFCYNVPTVCLTDSNAGNCKWVAVYAASSTMGFLIIKGLVDIYYINAMDVRAWWYKGILLVVCMAAGVAIFGGLVVGLWHLWDTKLNVSETEHDDDDDDRQPTGEASSTLLTSSSINSSIQYGSRPDFRGIWERLKEEWGSYAEVGVIVCGPSTMESSVARECRAFNLRRQAHEPIFHFHTHSFSF